MIDNYKKYQSNEWVEIQREMFEDENCKSILDEFNKKSTKIKMVDNFKKYPLKKSSKFTLDNLCYYLWLSLILTGFAILSYNIVLFLINKF